MDVFSAHEIIFVKSKFLEHRSFNVIIFFSDSIQNNHDLLIMEKTGTYRLNFFSQAASKLNEGIFNRFFKICRLIFGHIPFSEFNAQWLESCASKSCYMVMGGHWTVRSSFDQFFYEKQVDCANLNNPTPKS